MRKEIDAAVLFICTLVKRGGTLSDDSLRKFHVRLSDILRERFTNHWHPHRPWQGQAYRCLRVNGILRKEPTIERAASDCGVKYDDLRLPLEITIWVDPKEVCCRFGEHRGSYCTIADFHQLDKKQNFIDQIDFTKFLSQENNSEIPSLSRENKSNSTSSPRISPQLSCKNHSDAYLEPEVSRPSNLLNMPKSPPHTTYYNQLDQESIPNFPQGDNSFNSVGWSNSNSPSPVSQLQFHPTAYVDVSPVYAIPEYVGTRLVSSNLSFTKLSLDKVKLNFHSFVNGASFGTRQMIPMSAM